MMINKYTLAAYLDEFIRIHYLNEYSDNTLKQYRQSIQLFISWLPTDNELTKEDMLLYKKYLENTYGSTRSINKHITVINKYLKWMSKEDKNDMNLKDIKCDLCLKKIKTQEKASNDENLTTADYKRLLRKSKELGMDQLYLIIKILALTGIRISELKYFTVENIQKNKRYLRIYNKGKEREIVIRDDLSRELRKYCRRKKIKTGYIIRGEIENEMPNKSTIFRQLKKVAGIARVKKSRVHPHSFRHYYARKFLEAGGDIATLQQLLGHGSITTTAIYSQMSVEQKRAFLNNIKY